MADLSTTYSGIQLKNPIIAGASNLTRGIDSIKKIQQAGAAAVVFKSLFEEQIQLERLQLKEKTEEYDDINAEMTDVFPNVEHSGPGAHLHLLEKTREAISIPLIASINARAEGTWIEYARKIENTGVDAIELNLYFSPTQDSKDCSSIQNSQYQILTEIKKAVSIPVSVKLSYFYSNPFEVIKKMDDIGINGFVLFNRLFEPEIDPEKIQYSNPFNLSNNNDSRLPLRFTALLSGNIEADICTSTGIFDGYDVIKMILAGASCIQCVSTLYKNGISQISKMLSEITEWTNKKNYKSLNDFKGKLSKQNIRDPFMFGRNQYIDILLNKEPIIIERKM